MPNVKLFFNHKLTGADYRECKAWFEVADAKSSEESRPKEIDISFDLMIGADGAHSAVRYHLMKFTRMNYQQEYIDTLWCEFQLKPVKTDETADPMAKFRISPNHLHIWPGKDFMFIAIPSDVCSYSFPLVLHNLLTLLLRTAHSHAHSLCLARISQILRITLPAFQPFSTAISRALRT